MHAIVEDDLPQFLPAHNAEVVIVLVSLLRGVHCSRLQTHASICTSSVVFTPSYLYSTWRHVSFANHAVGCK